jgi:hypothetical protein
MSLEGKVPKRVCTRCHELHSPVDGVALAQEPVVKSELTFVEPIRGSCVIVLVFGTMKRMP